MKNRVCDIARDLMPLAIDSVASGSSKQFVEEHVTMCPDCEKIYREMKSAAPQAASPDESDRAFTRSVARMKRKRHIRLASILAGALAIAMVLAFPVRAMVEHMLYHSNSPIPFDRLEISLQQTPDGEALVLVRPKTSGRQGVAMYLRPDEGAERGHRFRLYCFEPSVPLGKIVWSHYMNVAPGDDYRFWVIDDRLYSICVGMQWTENGTYAWPEPEPVEEIFWGGDGAAPETTIYTAGDEIPVMESEEDIRIYSRCQNEGLPLYAQCAEAIIRGEPLPEMTVTDTPQGTVPSMPSESSGSGDVSSMPSESS